MRKQRRQDEVVNLFRNHYNIPLIHADASRHVPGPSWPASAIPNRSARSIGAACSLMCSTPRRSHNRWAAPNYLAQGTLYPDVIESVSFTGGPSVTIKSHHNVGGLPARMKMRLVEPLRELFKDEVRKLGYELGLPEVFVGRHPFPGPGLAIRCPGEITPEKLDILREADAVYIDQIRKAGLYDDIWQAFAVLLPVKTVGVMGDGRTYEYVVGLRAVTSTDGMTADFYAFDMKFLGETATRIINEVKGVNRVVYDITSKPPGTIEWSRGRFSSPSPLWGGWPTAGRSGWMTSRSVVLPPRPPRAIGFANLRCFADPSHARAGEGDLARFASIPIDRFKQRLMSRHALAVSRR